MSCPYLFVRPRTRSLLRRRVVSVMCATSGCTYPSVVVITRCGCRRVRVGGNATSVPSLLVLVVVSFRHPAWECCSGTLRCVALRCVALRFLLYTCPLPFTLCRRRRRSMLRHYNAVSVLVVVVLDCGWFLYCRSMYRRGTSSYRTTIDRCH